MPGLTDSQIVQFTNEGFLPLEDMLDPRQVLDPVVEEYTVILDRLARDLFAAGQVSSTYPDLPFAERLTAIQFETGESYHQHFDIALPKRNVAEQTPISVGPAVFSLLRNETLLDMVESLIGPEIFANPIQHVRLRQPVASAPGAPAAESTEAAPDWFHQDNAFMMPEADATEMVTVWLPLADAGVENGCLAVVPFSHRDGLMLHCNPGVTIPAQLTRAHEAVPVPLRRGGVLLMHRLMHHGPLPNHSGTVRWSFDLRYNPAGQPSGREVQPGFVARSRARPETEIRDPEEWAALWRQTRATLAGQPDPVYERWSSEDPGCA
jgi:hypothetical protein